MTRRATYGVNSDWRNLLEILVGEPREFNPDSATLRGRFTTSVVLGRLPDEYSTLAGHADYVIYSYSTPIAWRDSDDGKWYFPHVKYSVTTSKQQGRVLAALSQTSPGVVSV